MTSSASTVATRASVNGPATPTQLSYKSQWIYNSTTSNQEHFTAYDGFTATTQGSASETCFIIEGQIETGGTGGTFIPRVAAEVGSGGSVTVETGSYITYQALEAP